MTMQLTFDGVISGLVGTVGVTILNADGTSHAVRTTVGVAETPAGSARYVITDPDPTLTLQVLWDTGVGTAIWSETVYAGRAVAQTGDAYAQLNTLVGTPVNTGGTATIAAILGDPANSSLVARMTAVPAAVWNVLTSTLTTTNSIGKRLIEFVTTLVYIAPPAAAPAAIDNAAAVRTNLTTELADIVATAGHISADYGSNEKSAIDAIGTPANTGGIATLAAILGNPANVSLSAQVADIDGDLGEPVGATLSADIAAVKASADAAARPGASMVASNMVAAAPAASDIATAVWGAVTRTLTAGAGISAADVWGYATRTLSAFGFTPTPSNAADTTAIKAKTDGLPESPAAVGSAMALTSAYDHAKDDVLKPIAALSAAIADIPAGLDAAGVRAALGLAAADLDEQIAALGDPAQAAAMQVLADLLRAALASGRIATIGHGTLITGG